MKSFFHDCIVLDKSVPREVCQGEMLLCRTNFGCAGENNPKREIWSLDPTRTTWKERESGIHDVLNHCTIAGLGLCSS
jgi:hypothetical protein